MIDANALPIVIAPDLPLIAAALRVSRALDAFDAEARELQRVVTLVERASIPTHLLPQNLAEIAP